MNLVMKIVIGVLVMVALVLGYKIYDKKVGSVADISPVVTTNETVSSEVEKESGVNSIKEISAGDLTILKGNIDSNTPTETMNKYRELVAKYLVDSDTLTISNCEGSPFVVGVKNGSRLKLVNNDDIKRTISIGPKYKYDIPSKSTIEISTDFGYGEGNYGYVCWTKEGVAGIITIK